MTYAKVDLDTAEQRLNSGNQRGAFKWFEVAFYNSRFVAGGAQEILARGQRMRPKVTGKYAAKWDNLLAQLEAQVATLRVEHVPHPSSEPSPRPALGVKPAPEVAGPSEPRAIAPVDSRVPAPAASAPRAAVRVTQGMKPCPDCAEDVREKARICRYCGYKFAKTCPDCAEDVQVEARKCRHCGYRFAPTVSEVEAVDIQPGHVEADDESRRGDVA